MRTVTNSLKKKILAQAQEAETLGLNKIAQQLEHSISITSVREDDEEYTYDRDELKQDVEQLLWSAALRAQDFFGKTADARYAHDLIEDFAEDFIDQLRLKIGGKLGVYENAVAGQFEDIEVSDE